MHAIIRDLNEGQRTAVIKRLGVLNIWSPLIAVGPFSLQLNETDQQVAANIYLELEQVTRQSAMVVCLGTCDWRICSLHAWVHWC